MKNIFIFMLLAVFITNCSNTSPIAPNPVNIEEPQIGELPTDSDDPSINFKNELKNKDIVLSQEEIGIIKQYQSIRATGNWALSKNIDSGDKLISDFNEYQESLQPNGPDTVKKYLQEAINFSNSNNLFARNYFDMSYYNKRKRVLVVKYDTQTSEFIIIHLDGSISNYQKTEKIKEPRYIVIPDNLVG